MKRVIILIVVQLLVINCFAKTVRKTESLKSIPWNYAILLEGEMINSKNELNEQINILFDISYFDEVEKVIKSNASVISTIILNHKHSDLTILSLPDAAKVFDVWLNGKKLTNLQEDANFIADITSFNNQRQAVLVLKFRNDFKSLNDFKSSDLMTMISNFKIYSLSGVGISRFEPKKDTYFNSYLLQAHIRNFTGKDVDGKIYARFINKETLEVISENNNCAFTRSGDDIFVDVVFPEMGYLKSGQYIAEVEMVDKENDEEIIDKMSQLIRIW